MSQTYKVQVLTEKEFQTRVARDPRYRNAHDSLGFADPLKREAYVRDTAFPALNKYLIEHEFEHLLEDRGTDEDEHGIRHKKGFKQIIHPIAKALSYMLAPATGGLSLLYGPIADTGIAAQEGQRGLGRTFLKGYGQAAAGSLGPVTGSALVGAAGAAAGTKIAGGTTRDALTSGALAGGTQALSHMVTSPQAGRIPASHSAAPLAPGGSISAGARPSTGATSSRLASGIGRGGLQGRGPMLAGAEGLRGTDPTQMLPPGRGVGLNRFGPATTLNSPAPARMTSYMGQQLQPVNTSGKMSIGDQLIPNASAAEPTAASSGYTPTSADIARRQAAAFGSSGGGTPPPGGGGLNQFGYNPGPTPPGTGQVQTSYGVNIPTNAVSGAQPSNNILNQLGISNQVATGAGVSLLGNMLAPKPEVPNFGDLPSIQALRSRAGQPLSELGKLGQQRLSENLTAPWSGLQPGVEASIRDTFQQQRNNLISQFKALRPNADLTSDTAFRQAMFELDQQEAQAVGNIQQQEYARFQSQRSQDIATALGIDAQTLNELVELAGLDVASIAAKMQLDAESARQFKEMFGNIGTLIGTGGMSGGGGININLAGLGSLGSP